MRITANCYDYLMLHFLMNHICFIQTLGIFIAPIFRRYHTEGRKQLTSKVEHHWVNRLLVLVFLLMVSFIIIMVASETAWVVLEYYEFAFGLNILTPLLAVSASGVAFYSFVSYLQNKEIQNLMLVMIASSIILWAFFYLLTHPASFDWSPSFASQDRNRTVVVLLGLTFPPSILLGLLGKNAKTTNVSSAVLILWGLVIMPISYLLVLLSPDALFVVTAPEGGVLGFTPLGWIIVIFIVIATITAIFGYAKQWLNTRDSIDLSILLALLLWSVGITIIILLSDIFQVAELLWYSCLICGFFLISAAQIISSVIQPYRDLESIVEKRTNELEQSQRESDFFLNMWTHKMGNLLQGMVSYLEILEYAKQNSMDDQKTRSAAGRLSR